MGETSPTRGARAEGSTASEEAKGSDRGKASCKEESPIGRRGLVLREGSVTGTAVTGHVRRVRVMATAGPYPLQLWASLLRSSRNHKHHTAPTRLIFISLP